jgi:hypothetical protein
MSATHGRQPARPHSSAPDPATDRQCRKRAGLSSVGQPFPGWRLRALSSARSGHPLKLATGKSLKPGRQECLPYFPADREEQMQSLCYNSYMTSQERKVVQWMKHVLRELRTYAYSQPINEQTGGNVDAWWLPPRSHRRAQLSSRTRAFGSTGSIQTNSVTPSRSWTRNSRRAASPVQALEAS